VIKGHQVTDAEALAQLKIPAHETVVEVSAAPRIVVREHDATVDA
jgi:hypothetical protein